jgi:hypothetical protein
MAVTYLLATLFFAADYVATEERLAAGVKGYQQRAEALRKQAVDEAEKELKKWTASLAAARRGKIDPKIVGTKDSDGRILNGEFTFGTTAEKAQQISGLTDTVAEWREYLSGLRSKKIWPQVGMNMIPGATPGATGVFFWRFSEVEKLDKHTLIVLLTNSKFIDDDTPRLEHRNGGSLVEVRIENAVYYTHSTGLLKFEGVYQFVGTSEGKPMFRLVGELEIGDVELVFLNGRRWPSPPE